jgi:hypothetical protein
MKLSEIKIKGKPATKVFNLPDWTVDEYRKTLEDTIIVMDHLRIAILNDLLTITYSIHNLGYFCFSQYLNWVKSPKKIGKIIEETNKIVSEDKTIKEMNLQLEKIWEN